MHVIGFFVINIIDLPFRYIICIFLADHPVGGFGGIELKALVRVSPTHVMGQAKTESACLQGVSAVLTYVGASSQLIAGICGYWMSTISP